MDEATRQLRLRDLAHYKGFAFHRMSYKTRSPNWDHDECIGCWKRFAEFPDQWPEEVLTEGWMTRWPDVERTEAPIAPPGYTVVSSPSPQLDWICDDCFEACRDELKFKVQE